MYTERQDDRYGGRIPSMKWKAKVAIFKMIISLTGSLSSALKYGLACLFLLLRKRLSLRGFELSAASTSDHS